MSLTFIVVLLLVIGMVFANIALLRYGSKPMPIKKKLTTTAGNAPAAAEKTQAATVSAFPLSVAAPIDASNNDNETGNSSTNISEHNASGRHDSTSGGD